MNKKFVTEVEGAFCVTFARLSSTHFHRIKFLDVTQICTQTGWNNLKGKVFVPKKGSNYSIHMYILSSKVLLETFISVWCLIRTSHELNISRKDCAGRYWETIPNKRLFPLLFSGYVSLFYDVFKNIFYIDAWLYGTLTLLAVTLVCWRMRNKSRHMSWMNLATQWRV